MALDIRPSERGLPILDVQVFVGPRLVVSVMVGEVNSAVVMEIVFGTPVAKG